MHTCSQVIVDASQPLFEVSHSLPHRLGHLGEPLAKQQQGNHEEDDHFRGFNPEHRSDLSAGNPGTTNISRYHTSTATGGSGIDLLRCIVRGIVDLILDPLHPLLELGDALPQRPGNVGNARSPKQQQGNSEENQ